MEYTAGETTNNHRPQQQDNEFVSPRLSIFDDDNDSDVQLPTAPSPYSPPPSSLLDGVGQDDGRPMSSWKKKHPKRPPLKEVRLDGSRSAGAGFDGKDEGLDDDESTLEEQLRQMSTLAPPTPMVLNMPTPLSMTSQRSNHQNLLGAVLQLKEDLQESHQSAFLLQEENKALNHELEQLQKDADAEIRSSEERLQAVLQSETALQASVDKLTGDVERLKSENSVLEQRLGSLQQDSQMEAKKLKDSKESLANQVESLASEKKRLSESVAKLEAEKEGLSKDLMVSKVRVESASGDLKRLQKQVDELEQELREGRSKMKGLSIDSAKQIQTLKEELKSTRSTLEKEKAAQQLEIDRLKAIVRESESKTRNDRQADASRKAMEQENERLEKTLKATQQQNSALRGEKLVLRKELATTQQELRSIKNMKRVDASCQTDSKARTTEMSTQTEPDSSPKILYATEKGHSGDDHEELSPNTSRAISDRLGRIRDAAERAAIVQEYRRDVDRLQAEHDDRIAHLEKQHDRNLRRVVNDAKSEVSTRSKEYKKQLKGEYESKIEALEKQHSEELKKVSWGRVFMVDSFCIDASPQSSNPVFVLPAAEAPVGVKGTRRE